MAEKMKCLAVTGKRQIEILEVDKPLPRDNEVQIRIRACALCTWEQRTYTRQTNTPLPFVGGHEFSGEISAIGKEVNPNRFAIGTRVAARIIKSCQTCYYCRRGLPTQCEELYTFLLNGPEIYGMGGLAEYICLDSRIVWPFPDDISFGEIALTEPLACVLHSIHQADLKFGDDAVVIGGGTMGQLHLRCLNHMGIRTILSEPDEARREFALKAGCWQVIDPLADDPVEAVKKLTAGRGVESVFNTAAVPGVMGQALEMLVKTGTYIAFSSQHPDMPVPVSPGWLHSTEMRLTGAVNPSIWSFNQSATVLSKKIIDVRDLISGSYPLEKAGEAFEMALRADTYRILVMF